jgi:hypothetical protein
VTPHLRFLFLFLLICSVTAGSDPARIAFEPREPITLSHKPDLLASGDFDGDGRSDIVTLDVGSHGVDVVLGESGGRFVRRTVSRR